MLAHDSAKTLSISFNEKTFKSLSKQIKVLLLFLDRTRDREKLQNNILGRLRTRARLYK
jgi:hypothetical protein